jgi:AcrR family transcriptional regulator
LKDGEQKNGNTLERLLNAAGEVFSRRGYRAATVREICRRASANVAAVNYHFGDKKGLYGAVLNHAFDTARKKYPPDFGLEESATPQERLHAFIRSLLFRILDEGRPAWHGKLLAREVAEPTSAFHLMIENAVRPIHVILAGIVRELMGNGRADDDRVSLCVLSIIGQCLFYQQARPVVATIYGHTYDTREIEQIAGHITQFSLHAIQAISSEQDT